MRRRTATFGKQTPPQNVLRGATPTQDEDAAEAINDSTTFLARAATGPSYNLTTCPRLKLLTLLLALFVLGALYR